jgi:hypothetical protein
VSDDIDLHNMTGRAEAAEYALVKAREENNRRMEREEKLSEEIIRLRRLLEINEDRAVYLEEQTTEARLEKVLRILRGVGWQKIEVGDVVVEAWRPSAPPVPSDFKRACTSCYARECLPDANVCEGCRTPPERLVLHYVLMTFRDGRQMQVEIKPGEYELHLPPDVVSIRTVAETKAEPIVVVTAPHRHRLVGIALETAGACYDCGVWVSLQSDGTLQPSLPCGCPSGAHPNQQNYLSGAAERDGRTCKLGWPAP